MIQLTANLSLQFLPHSVAVQQDGGNTGESTVVLRAGISSPVARQAERERERDRGPHMGGENSEETNI